MPRDKMDDQATTGTAIMPRSTIEEIVGYRNKALELYAEAFAAIKRADAKIKAAHGMAARAAPGHNSYNHSSAREIEAFTKAVQLPERDTYLRVARRLTDLNTWAWIVERTDLERLMDKEAKDTLRRQMQYVPDRVDRRGQLITGDEVEMGMPDITVENVYATLQQFQADADMIFRRGVANAFSKLDRRFRSHDGFKIGGRIILDRLMSDSGRFSYDSYKRDTLLDVERAFSIVDGQNVKAAYAGIVGQIEANRSGCWHPREDLIESTYFRVRIYKNGNGHLWMKRPDVVEKINKVLAEWYGEVIGDGDTAEPDIFAEVKTTPAKRFGFFPTPGPAADTLMEKVPLYREKDAAPFRILEPSAGTGNLARLCAIAGRPEYRDEPAYDYGHKVDVVEIQPTMADALRDEGIYNKVVCADFLQLKPDPRQLYDIVVMNPPFDRERDIDHVMHALKFLKPDGFLTAIMSAGTEFRETRKAIAFRAAIEKLHGRWEDLPAGSFAEVGTNVNTRILRLRKDGSLRRW
jgi:predicted RNA methylase